MNLALSTFLIFVFLLPGIFFRRFYFSKQFSNEYFKETIIGVFLDSLIPCLIMQSIWFYVIQIFGYKIDLAIMGCLVSKKTTPLLFKNIQNNTFNILLYHVTLLIFSSLSGYFLRKIVRQYKLDRRLNLFRFKNRWHYILTGEFFDFPGTAYDLEENQKEIDIIFIDALIETNEGSIIYEGIFLNYELSGESGLDTLTLKNVRRRYLRDDCSNKKSKYHNIPGHNFTLKYSEIINLNFSYYKLDFNKKGGIIPRLIK